MQAELQHLKAVNADLQWKLESQTQRLELAIQQQAHATPRAAFSSSSPTVMASAALQPDTGSGVLPQMPSYFIHQQQTRRQQQQQQQQQQQWFVTPQPTDALTENDSVQGLPKAGSLQGSQEHDRYVQSTPATPVHHRAAARSSQSQRGMLQLQTVPVRGLQMGLLKGSLRNARMRGR